MEALEALEVQREMMTLRAAALASVAAALAAALASYLSSWAWSAARTN